MAQDRENAANVDCGYCHTPITTTGSGHPVYGPVHVQCWHKAIADPTSRLRVLLKRIREWEDMEDAVGQFEGAEALLLDIKQCLESICEAPPNGICNDPMVPLELW